MCYNLGADTTLSNPFVYKSTNDSTSKDIKGWLFQWGRIADGHQWRNTARAIHTGTVDLPNDDQVPEGNAAYGKLITSNGRTTFYDWRTPQISWLWYSYKTGRDPCPADWQLPTQSDFASIISDNHFSRQNPADATANSWVWTTSGFQIRPDGSTTTLFLPAAGDRDGAGLRSVGSNGGYWSSTASASGAFNLHFESEVLAPGDGLVRSLARSVRCVANH
jgi:uncharacterized protein (TIGR02145 family)